MSTTISYAPVSPKLPPTSSDQVTIQGPLPRDKEQKTPLLQKVMPFIMGGAMLGMVALMLFGGGSGGRMSPMMMMMPLMLIASLGGTIQASAGANPELDSDREDYIAMLGQMRGPAHAVGRGLHAVQTYLYPNPKVMAHRAFIRHESLWSAQRPTPGSTVADEMVLESNGDINVDTFMKARVGVGLMALSPSIQLDEEITLPPDKIEPLTHQACLNFLATQNVVPNTPIPIALENSGLSFRGDIKYVRPLVRAMVCSMAYNHSPLDLIFAFVGSEQRIREDWAWARWLPHTIDTFQGNLSHHLFFTSYTELRQWLDTDSHYTQIMRDGVELVVILDDSTCTPRLPGGGLQAQNVTVIAVDCATDKYITTERSRILIDENLQLSMFESESLALADQLSVEGAEEVARALARYRPVSFGQHNEARDNLSSDEFSARLKKERSMKENPTYLEALGLKDTVVEKFDLHSQWRSTDGDASFKAPLGFEVERAGGEKPRPTGKTIYLDILQKASGGTGPHGLFSGGTGSGKSFTLKPFILALCFLYSPNKLNIISSDFKGGATFNDMQFLPHFQANLTNLAGALDVVDRARDVLEGENVRRQELFNQYGVEDIKSYRKMRKKDDSMPNLPDLLFVADEFREFIKKNPGYKEMFNSIAAVGRSTGIHLLLGSQFLDQNMLGEAMANFDFGFSLKVAEAAHSNVVIKSPAAKSLPSVGVGILWRQDLTDSIHEMFQGYNHALAYMRPVESAMKAPEVIEHEEPEIVTSPEKETVIDAQLFGALETSTRTLPKESRFSSSAPVVKEETPDEAPAAEKYEKTDIDQFTAVLNLVMEKGKDYTQTYRMWQTPMSTPMTMSDVPDAEFSPRSEKGISIRIGDIDVPERHTRLPMELEFDSARNNTLVVGAPGRGKSTVLRTLVASSALRYPGKRLSWFLYDYNGNSQAAIKHFPNVAAYGSRSDTDVWHRMQGEVTRLIAVRTRALAQGISNIEDYFTAKAAGTLNVNDPYDYIMVTIDGFDDFMISVKDGKDPDAVNRWVRRFKDAPRLGIYFVCTTKSGQDSMLISKFNNVFTNGIRLSVSEPANTYNWHEARTAPTLRDVMERLPATQPGRVADGSVTDGMGTPRFHHGLIMLPIAEPVQGTIDPVTRQTVYDYKEDHTEKVEFLGNHLNTIDDMVENRAHKLEIVTTDVPLSNIFDGADLRAISERLISQRVLPYGRDTATYDLAGINMSRDAGMRHLIITGDTKTGITNTMRTLMQSVAAVYRSKKVEGSPQEATFAYLDANMSLNSAAKVFHDLGYSSEKSYFLDKDAADTMIRKLTAMAKQRVPDSSDPTALTPEVVQSRTYYEGSEVFLFVDDATQWIKRPGDFSGRETALDELLKFLGTCNYDVGVHVFMSLPAPTINSVVSTCKSVSTLINQDKVFFLLHSGPVGIGNIINSARFKFQELPVGRIRLANMSKFPGPTLPEIQVAHSMGDAEYHKWWHDFHGVTPSTPN